jgi:hypothetical protein
MKSSRRDVRHCAMFDRFYRYLLEQRAGACDCGNLRKARFFHCFPRTKIRPGPRDFPLEKRGRYSDRGRGIPYFLHARQTDTSGRPTSQMDTH